METATSPSVLQSPDVPAGQGSGVLGDDQAPPPAASRIAEALGDAWTQSHSFHEIHGDVVETAVRLVQLPEYKSGRLHIVNCISEDRAMKLGLAAQLRAEAGRPTDSEPRGRDTPFKPRVLIQRPACPSRLAGTTIVYLITKREHHHSPRRRAVADVLREALASLPPDAVVIMPRIGCGLDGLSWDGENGMREIVRRTHASVAPPSSVWVLSVPPYEDMSGGGGATLPSYAPSVTPEVWQSRLVKARPGCGEASCAMCALWLMAVDENKPAKDVNRKEALDAAVLAVMRARELGFQTHTAFVSGDKIEDGSSDPASDSPELLAALAEADQELRAHASPVDVPPMTPDPAVFHTARLLADAQGLHYARAAAGRMLPASVRAIEEMSAEDWWEVATGVIHDLSSGSLRRFVPAPGRHPPVAAFPFIVHQHGKARLCINYKPFNSVFNESSYRLPTPRDLALAGTSKAWMVKLDLRQAFRRVRVPRAVGGAIGCAAAGSLFVYDNLPFGWVFAPEVFATTLAPAVRRVREALSGLGVVIVYVDDIAIAADSPVEAVRAATTALKVLREFGFVASCKKSFLRPVRNLRFLGVTVTAGERPAIAVTREMTERVARLGQEAALTVRSAEALAEVWGLVSFLAYTVRPRLALYRAALDPAASAAMEGAMPWVGDGGAEEALAGLVRKAAAAVVVAWAEGPHDIFRKLGRPRAALSSDASSSGGAAQLAIGREVRWRRVGWTLAEAATPSAGKELLVAATSLQEWGPLLRGHTVDWMCDATAATSAMRSWGSSSAASEAALRLCEQAMSLYDIEVEPWWYARSSPEIRDVDGRSRTGRLRVPAAGVASIAFGAEAVGAAAGACGVRAPSLHHMWIPRSQMVAPSYTSQLPGGGVRGAGAGAEWAGVPSPRSWTGHVVWAPLARSARSQAVEWLAEAARDGPCAVLLPAPASVPLHPAVDGLAVAQAPLARGGERVLQWNVEGAQWDPARTAEDWVVHLLFASPTAPVGRSLSRAERLAALHASGFPPHPGPTRRRLQATAVAGRAALVGGATAAATIDAALQSHRPPPTYTAAGGGPGRDLVVLDAACAARPPPPVAGAMRTAVEGGGSAAVDSWPSMREVLDAAASEAADETIQLAIRMGWLTPTLRRNPVVRAQVAAALVELDSIVGSATGARASRVAGQLRLVAEAAGMQDEPYSLQALDTLTTVWVRTRLGLPGAIAVQMQRTNQRVPTAPSVAADAGALAARLRRRLGTWAPQLVPGASLGPMAQRLLLARGASARHDSSPKRVVWGWELRWGLQHNTHIVALHPEAVAALLAMGGSMWRSIYIRNLRRCDAMWFGAPAGPARAPGVEVPVTTFPSRADTDAFRRPPASVGAGAAAPPPQARSVVFRWDGAHKTNRHAGDASLPSTPRWGFVAAPWVLAVMGPFVPETHDPADTRPLFPDPRSPGREAMSYAYLSGVLVALLKGLPDADKATLHGLRLGCDAELRAHGVADEIRDALGWWKRLVRRMSEHYEALDAARLVAAVALYGTLLAQSLAPGLMATSALFRGVPLSAAAGSWFRESASRTSTAPVIPPLATAAVAEATASYRHTAAATTTARGGRTVAAGVVRRCHGCGETGHNVRTCPGLRLRPEARLFSEPGDDLSESDSEDDDHTNKSAARRPPLAPRGLPHAIVEGSTGARLARASVHAAAARSVAAAAADAAGTYRRGQSRGGAIVGQTPTVAGNGSTGGGTGALAAAMAAAAPHPRAYSGLRATHADSERGAPVGPGSAASAVVQRSGNPVEGRAPPGEYRQGIARGTGPGC